MIDKIISIDETTLNRVLSKHFKDGFIIITADKSYITDTERKERFNSLKRDVVNAGYSYIPVYGGYKETDPETGKQYDAPSFEYGLLVPNQKPFSNKSKDDDNLIELGKKLAAKYDQETFLYKPKGDDYNSYWVDANGNFVQNFKGLTINDMSQEFFTKLYHSKNPQKKDRRFTLVTEIYLNKAPNNASEAYSRFGEQFFNLNENKMFHLSNNPNLVIDKNYKPKQGQLGKGFYVTKNINDWGEESIGKRDYIYQIINFDELNIAKPTDQPSRKELVDFGLKMGFYKMGKVIKPNGEIVKDLDGNDLIRPIETDKYKKYATYQDPMTGSSIDFLEQEYLKSKGFDGKEPYYSRDGHQIIIWNYDKIKLKRIK